MRGLREEQLALAIAEAAAPLRSAAATLLELQGKLFSSPKAALETWLHTSDNSSWVEAHKHISQARDRAALPAGIAGRCLLRLIEIAQSFRTQLTKLKEAIQ